MLSGLPTLLIVVNIFWMTPSNNNHTYFSLIFSLVPVVLHFSFFLSSACNVAFLDFSSETYILIIA